MAGDKDLFKALNTGQGKGGYPDTHSRLVGRGWSNAFPTNTIFDNRSLPAWLFGTPTLYAQGNAIARWQRGDTTIETEQKGSTSWVVELRPGVQSGWDDAAQIEIPVNEMPVGDFDSATWTYWMKNAEAHGVNIGFGVHNPANIGQRIQINQAPSQATLAKAAAWNSHNFDKTLASQCFYYEDAAYGATVLEGPTHLYSFNQIIQDAVFDSWTIYRIVISFGWYNAGSFESAYVADVILNGQVVQLKPSVEEQLEMVRDDIAKAITTIPTWKFGQPELRADNSGWARWEKESRNALYALSTDTNRQFRQGPWAVHLNGGLQGGGWDDTAQLQVPVNNIPLKDFTEIYWTYYKFLAGTADVGVFGPNIGICTHNPDDFDERAEISLLMEEVSPVTEGWHDDVITPTDPDYLFYYGNNITSDLVEGTPNYYTLAEYQADKAFSKHTVYMIKINYGLWGGTRSTGDVWVGNVRINGENIKLEPSDPDNLGTSPNLTGNPFGEPTLTGRNNGCASWARGCVSPLDQKSATGWLANLYGGIQTGDDFARIEIPVNELPVPLLHTAMWTYYLTEAESFGVNMVIWAHDPQDHSIRAEITQQADIATLEKALGWNNHELNQTTNQFYYYGEGITNTSLITGAGPANLFGWDDFQGDERFNTMTIYKITFEYGWQSGDNEFKDAWVADIKLNGQLIPLKPDSGGSGRIARRYAEGTTGAVSFTIAPKTPYRLLSMSVHAGAALVTAELLTITKDCGLGTDGWGDAVVFSDDLFIGTRLSLFVPFGEGYDFPAEDELDVTQANSGNQDLSIIATYQTVFA